MELGKALNLNNVKCTCQPTQKVLGNIILHSLIVRRRVSQQVTWKMLLYCKQRDIGREKCLGTERVEQSWRYLLCTHIIILKHTKILYGFTFIIKIFLSSLVSLFISRFSLCLFSFGSLSLSRLVHIYNNMNVANFSSISVIETAI